MDRGDVRHARCVDPAAFLAGHPVALSVYEAVCDRLGALGAFDVRTVHHPDEIDGEVVEWLREAFERAG